MSDDGVRSLFQGFIHHRMRHIQAGEDSSDGLSRTPHQQPGIVIRGLGAFGGPGVEKRRDMACSERVTHVRTSENS